MAYGLNGRCACASLTPMFCKEIPHHFAGVGSLPFVKAHRRVTTTPCMIQLLNLADLQNRFATNKIFTSAVGIAGAWTARLAPFLDQQGRVFAAGQTVQFS